MMEKWLPAALKNSKDSFYENLIIETEKIMNEYLDQKIRTIKNIYSISNSSLQDLLDIASDIYLLDRNVLESTYEFLKAQVSQQTVDYPDEITKIISLFFQLNFIPHQREVTEQGYTYIQKGVVLENPRTTDFSGNVDNYELFLEMIRAHVPGIKIEFINLEDPENPNQFFFVYPIGFTPDMEDNYIQSLRNAVCDYALQYNTGFESMLAKDPVTEGWVNSLTFTDNSAIAIIYTDDLGKLNDLGETVKFHVEYSSYNINTLDSSLTVTWQQNDDIALAQFRNEIAKIPFSIANRGTFTFYKSLFNTLGFNFPGIISLLKTEDNEQFGRLIDNIKINKHSVEGSETSFVPIPIDEKFNAQELITNILDDNIGTEENPEYRTLDSNDLFNKLDMISTIEETAYKKDILIGFNINQRHFKGESVYPAEFIKFVQELAKLNQKATDTLHFTGILSIDIDKDNLVKSLPENNSFVEVTSTSEPYMSNYSHHLIVEEYVNGSYKAFYDYYPDKPTDIFWDTDESKSDNCLTTKVTIEGNKYRLSNRATTVVSSKQISMFLGGYDYMLTNHVILKLFIDNDEDNGYFLFKQNQFGKFIQVDGPRTETGALYYDDIEVTIENGDVLFTSEKYDFASTGNEYLVTLVSDKAESKVSRISLWQYGGMAYSNKLWTIEFKDEQNNNLYIDLPLNMDLMTIVSRHEAR